MRVLCTGSSISLFLNITSIWRLTDIFFRAKHLHDILSSLRKTQINAPEKAVRTPPLKQTWLHPSLCPEIKASLWINYAETFRANVYFTFGSEIWNLLVREGGLYIFYSMFQKKYAFFVCDFSNNCPPEPTSRSVWKQETYK